MNEFEQQLYSAFERYDKKGKAMDDRNTEQRKRIMTTAQTYRIPGGEIHIYETKHFGWAWQLVKGDSVVAGNLDYASSLDAYNAAMASQ